MKGTSILAGLVLVGTTSCGSASTKAAEAPKPDVLSAAAKARSALAAGMMAPDFVAPGHDGQRVTPSGYRGRTLILFFYTRAGTPNDTREACDFRDKAAELRDRGIAVVGVSTDDVEAQKSFAKLHRLPYELVSDPSGVIANAYGVPNAYGVLDRRTFVIGPDGTIEKVFENVNPTKHVEEVVSVL